MAPGRLYLLPAWLAEDAPAEDVVPAPVLARIRGLDTFIVENAKSARAWLAACGHPRPLREVGMVELNEHTRAANIPALLDPIVAGRDTGLLSEAGLPAIADPGALLVAAAHARGIKVVPHVGPAESAARRAKVAELERHSANNAETQVFIETPYRNDALLGDILQSCRPATRLAVAAELTSPNEWIRSDSVDGWRARPATIGKRPAIFLLLAR